MGTPQKRAIRHSRWEKVSFLFACGLTRTVYPTVGVTSPFHSPTSKKAKQRRKLVQTFAYVSYLFGTPSVIYRLSARDCSL